MVEEGCAVCWGGGDHGQNGHGEGCTVAVTSPTDLASNILSLIPNENYLLSCGSSHTVCVSKEAAYVWGNGSDGQLGTGDLLCRYTPCALAIPFDQTVTSIAGVSCGSRHSIVWTEDGLCYGFGSNSFSQLALSTDDSINIDKQCVPVLLSALQHEMVIQVACGTKHSVFLYQCGTVVTVGDNNHGQLGVGSRMPHNTPQVLQDIENVKLISSGANHCLAVTESGELYIWGYGKAIGYKHKDIVRPTKKLSHYTNIVQIVGGATHSLALTENGNVYSWGLGADGQLGLGEEQTFAAKPTRVSTELKGRNICQISASDFLSSALSTDGSLYIWGKTQQVMPTHIGSLAVFLPVHIELGNGAKLKSVSCGTWHVVAVTGSCKQVVKDMETEVVTSDTTDSNLHSDLPYMLTPDSSAANSVCGLSGPSSSSCIDGNSTSSPSSTNSTSSDTGRLQLQVSRLRDKKTLADFYAPTPDMAKPGLTVLGEVTDEYCDSIESIILPDVKLPHIIDATRGISAASVRRSRAFSAARKSTDYRTISPTDTEDDEDEIESSLPQVTITRNASRVNTVSSMQSSVHTEHMKKSSSGSANRDSAVIKLKVADTSSLMNEKKVTNGISGTWNPYRNSMFNSNVFHDNHDRQLSPGVNAKMIGFLDMSDIQLVDKPVAQMTKADRVGERHSQLYSKEMEMRNSRAAQFNTNYHKVVSRRHTQQIDGAAGDHMRPHYPMQKVSRRTQISKHKAEHLSMWSGQDTHHTQSLEQFQSRVVRPYIGKTGGLRDHYHSFPNLVNGSFVNKPLPRPVYPSVPDFSKAMTKLDIQPGKTTKLKRS